MAKKEKKVKENKKNSHYFKDMKAELKKVIWPSAKQTANNTAAVIVFTLIAAVIVFVLDLCFDSINKYGVTPLQAKIQSSYNAKVSESETTDEENTENETETENAENASEEDKENIEVENTKSKDNKEKKK